MTEATVVVLKLIKSVLKSLVHADTNVYDRISSFFYVIHFTRIWRQYNYDNGIPTKFFFTQNVYHGLEMNLVMIIKLITERKLQYIHLMSSQNNEEFFRTLRSYTGMESMMVNCTMKGFISRIRYMQLEEILMNDLKDKYKFPKIEKRQTKKLIIPEELSDEKIKELINLGKRLAEDDAKTLGINCEVKNLEEFCKMVSASEPSELDNDDNFDEDFLGATTPLRNENIEEEDTSSNITVNQNGKECTISKSKYCKQLQTDKKRVSVDIQERFVTKKSVIPLRRQQESTVWKDNIVSRGDWIAIMYDCKYMLGRVINFQKSLEKTKGKKLYIHDYIDLQDERSANIFVLLEPLHIIQKRKLILAENFTREYFHNKCYISHVINDLVDIGNEMAKITKIYMESMRIQLK